MNKKDLAEIKRRFQLEHNNITCIRGCYVNNQGQVISSFTRSLINMGQEEAEKYLAIFRRTLSGTQGQNLLDIDFSPDQVRRGPEHQLLMTLKDTALLDEQAVEDFFQQVILRFHSEDHYLILLMHDGYDLPVRTGPDHRRDEEKAYEVFHYVLCSMCPVKLTKPALTYDPAGNDFRSKEADWAVGAPEMGFLFPAFEERAANIYRALYYTRDTALSHEDFVDAVFHAGPPMPAAVQKETFHTLLQETLQEDLSYEVVQAVHDQVIEKMEEQKAEKDTEPLKISKYDVKDVLLGCGVAPARVEDFDQRYDETFGSQTPLSAVNVTSPKQFEVRMPSVVIRVQGDRSDLVETRLIDGHPYILIRADEGVEVNGVSVSLPRE